MVMLSYFYYSAKLLNYVHLKKCSSALVVNSLAYLPQSTRVFPVGNGSLKGRGVEGVGGETLLLDVA